MRLFLPDRKSKPKDGKPKYCERRVTAYPTNALRQTKLFCRCRTSVDELITSVYYPLDESVRGDASVD